MADIFLSYARDDREIAACLAELLIQSGWSVWWDREIQPRADLGFDQVIERELQAARCVIVLWSSKAIESHWVKAEALEALDSGKLIQARLDDAKPPLVYRTFQTASLAGWDKTAVGDGFVAIRAAVGHFAQKEMVLSKSEAESIIQEVAVSRRTEVGSVQAAAESVVGTQSFKARASDGKGVVYCHASGTLRGRGFYVRKGIGYFYEYILQGAESPLGLPVSHEEVVDGNGFPTSFFERGYIEWSPESSVARAVVIVGDQEEVFAERLI
ncbi:MAG: toll/interleukin-1 receptor domain-containing protein [Acidobacteriota bacterium]